MKMRFVEFEGTPAEFEQVRHHFSFNSVVMPTVPAATDASPASNGGSEASLSQGDVREIVLHALTRRRLPDTMKAVFRALLKTPKGLSSAALAKELQIDRGQLSGVFGAFGRRLTHTPGYPDTEDAWIARNEWLNGERHYTLTPLGKELLSSGRVKLD